MHFPFELLLRRKCAVLQWNRVLFQPLLGGYVHDLRVYTLASEEGWRDGIVVRIYPDSGSNAGETTLDRELIGIQVGGQAQWTNDAITTSLLSHFDVTMMLLLLRVPAGRFNVHSAFWLRYDDVIMGVIVSQITSLTIVCSTVYSDADQRKQQSSASLAFVRGIHRGPVNSPHRWPVTRKMFLFHDVIMLRKWTRQW